jgi:hypothetical protein
MLLLEAKTVDSDVFTWHYSCVKSDHNNDWVLLQRNLARLHPSSLSSNFSVLEVSTGEYGDHNGALVAAIKNGKCNDWRRRQAERSSFSYLGKTVNKLYIAY